MLYLAWRHGGADPYRTYHLLDEHYYPLDGQGAQRKPKAPERLRMLLYAFALQAEQEELQKAGAKLQGGGG